MPIASLIVRLKTDNIDEVAEMVDSIENANVTKIEENNLIVLTETKDRKGDQAIWDAIELIDGVIALDLIYYHFEELVES